ncbi:MAG: DGQHR domain-containing protein [Trueperaceae bacterium]
MRTVARMSVMEQDARELYVGAMRAEDIIRLGRVAEWTEENSEQGYQRAPERSRIRKLANFLKTEGVPMLPTSVLLSHRGEPLERRDLDDGTAEITFPDDEVLWIVDGQHRVKALEVAIKEDGLERFKSFMLPVVIVEFPNIEEEAHQFQIINENMKKVNTQLARRLLALRLARGDDSTRRAIRQTRRLWEAETVEVIKELQAEPESPWSGRIQPPNTRKSADHIVRELSFSTSLKPILTDEVCIDLGTERIANFLVNYWEAWSQLLLEAFETPGDYVIQKTPGIFSLHAVARYLLKVFIFRRMTEPTVDDIKVVLSDAGEAATAGFWESGNAHGAAMAGSMAGFKILADEIIDTLQSNGHQI